VCTNDSPFYTRWQSQAGITNFTRLFSEDRSEKFFFRRKLRFALRCNLTNENITRLYFSSDPDNPGLIKIRKCFLSYIRNISCDFFVPKFRIPGNAFKLFNMNRAEHIFLNNTFTDKD